MDDRKRRRSSENAEDIESIFCLSKKQNLVDVNTSIQRPSSAPNFTSDETESTKPINDCTSSETAVDDSMLCHDGKNEHIPDLTGEMQHLSTENSSNEDHPIEEEQTSHQRVDTFKMALEQIEDLQRSLYDDSSMESDDELDLKDHLEGLFGPDPDGTVPRLIDPQTLGFLMCAQETMKYLFEHGVKKDNPVVINLRNRLIQGIQQHI